MQKTEIIDVFKELNIKETDLPDYKDPYMFTQKIKRVSAMEFESVSYSSGTGLWVGGNNAKLE